MTVTLWVANRRFFTLYGIITGSLSGNNSFARYNLECFYIFQAVNITGLGLFSLLYRKLDLGTDRKICVQRPIFVLSEKFAKTHALNYTKYQSPGRNFTLYSKWYLLVWYGVIVLLPFSMRWILIRKRKVLLICTY